MPDTTVEKKYFYSRDNKIYTVSYDAQPQEDKVFEDLATLIDVQENDIYSLLKSVYSTGTSLYNYLKTFKTPTDNNNVTPKTIDEVLDTLNVEYIKYLIRQTILIEVTDYTQETQA